MASKKFNLKSSGLNRLYMNNAADVSVKYTLRLRKHKAYCIVYTLVLLLFAMQVPYSREL